MLDTPDPTFYLDRTIWVASTRKDVHMIATQSKFETIMDLMVHAACSKGYTYSIERGNTRLCCTYHEDKAKSRPKNSLEGFVFSLDDAIISHQMAQNILNKTKYHANR